MVSAMSAVAGHLVWFLLMLFWRGESTPYFISEPGAAIALVVGFAFAGYLQGVREWHKNERDFLTAVESENCNQTIL